MLVSAASYHLIEKPILDSKWLLPKDKAKEAKGSSRRIRDLQLAAFALVTVLIAVYAVTSQPEVEGGGTVPVSALPIVGTEKITPEQQLQTDIASSLNVAPWGTPNPSLDGIRDSGAPEWRKDDCLNTSAANAANCAYGSAKARRLRSSSATPSPSAGSPDYARSWSPRAGRFTCSPTKCAPTPA